MTHTIDTMMAAIQSGEDAAVIAMMGDTDFVAGITNKGASDAFYQAVFDQRDAVVDEMLGNDDFMRKVFEKTLGNAFCHAARCGYIHIFSSMLRHEDVLKKIPGHVINRAGALAATNSENTTLVPMMLASPFLISQIGCYVQSLVELPPNLSAPLPQSNPDENAADEMFLWAAHNSRDEGDVATTTLQKMLKNDDFMGRVSDKIPEVAFNVARRDRRAVAVGMMASHDKFMRKIPSNSQNRSAKSKTGKYYGAWRKRPQGKLDRLLRAIGVPGGMALLGRG